MSMTERTNLSSYVGKRVKAIYMKADTGRVHDVIEFDDGSLITAVPDNLFDADGMCIENDGNFRP